MKKLVALLSPAIYLSIASSALAAAGDVPISTCDTTGQFAILCKLTSGDFGTVIGTAIQLIFVVAVIVALLYLIYGGFRWLVSSGDKAQVAAAREHLVAAIIGLVIIFLSYFILNLLLGFFNVGSLSSLTIPTVQLNH
ncbi:MAG: hypothetical protein ABSD69_01105 [Candidatus Levyibacteriota bacterium]|jgi:hypothetical protein